MEESKASKVTPVAIEANESKLIESAQEGDSVAFGKLVRIHQKRLFRFIYGMIGSFDQAEDIVQDAFVRAYKAIDSFKPGFAFYPWLARIARNLALNLIHREEKKESLDRLTEQGFDPATNSLGPFENLLDAEGKKRFYEALKAMPAKNRSVFVLRQFEEMDYASIASYLKIPPGTVDSRLHRARSFLLEALGDLLE